ncbi:glycoside hydrolase [Catenovulum sp. SM1970]|uniref:glycosyl hydrolase family 18 protein n=1 Tax=Marinifaba aquimaris TaxID=2741323 RepID=UPI0015728949|nr:glycosyl hydrolase family 18 protein [Marinifaba aquimaris]NTS75525.1 glycoside hydrolase [Marinifaba aquimaris]
MKKSLLSLAVLAALPFTSNALASTPVGFCDEMLWDASKTYTKGDMIAYNEVVFEAQWWTQGQDPKTNSGGWKVWRENGEICSSSNTDTNTDVQFEADITLIQPVDGSIYYTGDVVNMSADVVSGYLEVEKVVFKLGDEIIAEDAVRPYEIDWVADKVGTHQVSMYADSGFGYLSNVETSTITVKSTDDGLIDPTPGFKVVGYFPSWQGNVSDIQFDKLTHINYSFLLPNADGSFKPLENTAKFQQLINAAKGTDTKIGIAIGGWNGGDDSAFETFAGTAQGRTNFVNNVMAFVNQYGIDGVDMDWEYPDPGTSATNFALLMKQLSEALHAEGKFLTAAVVALGYTGGGVLESVFNDVDFLNLMAYDANNTDHANYQYALDSIAYWKGRGLSKEKTVLGVPFYSRAGWKSYKQLVTANIANACRDTDGQAYYNGIPTIRAKTKLALEQAGGIMNWELSHDTNGPASLVTAKWEVANNIAPSFNCGDNNTDTGTDTSTDTDTGTDVVPNCSDVSVNPATIDSYPNWPHNDWSGKPSHALAGDQLIYNGQVFEAKWWTNSVPGSDDTWNTICKF